MNLLNVYTLDNSKGLGGIGFGWCLIVSIWRVAFGFALWMPARLFWHGIKNNTVSYFYASRGEIQVRFLILQVGLYLIPRN